MRDEVQSRRLPGMNARALGGEQWKEFVLQAHEVSGMDTVLNKAFLLKFRS